MGKSKMKKTANSIVENRKAKFDFFIEETIEAGISLEGWEVKSLRAQGPSITESYILLKDGLAYLFGATITPLLSASTHNKIKATRTRPLLMHRREINKLSSQIDIDGKTAVPLEMYWKNGKVKLKIGVAKGKKQHDKRAAIKDRDWSRDKMRTLKANY